MYYMYIRRYVRTYVHICCIDIYYSIRTYVNAYRFMYVQYVCMWVCVQMYVRTCVLGQYYYYSFPIWCYAPISRPHVYIRIYSICMHIILYTVWTSVCTYVCMIVCMLVCKAANTNYSVNIVFCICLQPLYIGIYVLSSCKIRSWS